MKGTAFAIWVRDSLMILLLFCSLLAGAQETDPTEVAALLDVKGRLVDPLGYLSSWNEGDPCINKWDWIRCVDKAADDRYLHISAIQLLNKSLSGNLSPMLGNLNHLEILDFMWNNIEGTIPKEIGNIMSLKLLLLNGNRLSGSLPDELGNLSNLDRLQIDENNITGSLPKSLANLVELKHMHMNNNSISGQIPPELANLPKIIHILLDNNNLSGYLPPDFSKSRTLTIIQLDNNNFSGSSIPSSYNNISTLLKLSLRNCHLHGFIPDFSGIPMMTYLDLSWNQLEGSIPTNKLSNNITTIDFSNNKLTGSIPTNFSGLPGLQKLSLRNNRLNGSIPAVWEGVSIGVNASLTLDFENNFLSGILSLTSLPPNVTMMLHGNQICSRANQFNIQKFCIPLVKEGRKGSSAGVAGSCLVQSCPTEEFFDYIPDSPVSCFCAAPIRVGYRLKSPGFSDFSPYMKIFQDTLSLDLGLNWYQISFDSFVWEEGPRLRMYLEIFPNLTRTFNKSEVLRIRDLFAGWKIHNRDIFGPYELLNFTLLGPYSSVPSGLPSTRRGLGTIIGIVLGAVCAAIMLLVFVLLLMVHSKLKHQLISDKSSKNHKSLHSEIKINGVERFTFEEVAKATNYFSDSNQIGKGGFGKVYKAILPDGTVVAVKRAQEDSLQGHHEFFTEIELLSRLHHRNLVSLVGYCNDQSEQMLLYEFMPNGTLQDHLSYTSTISLDFSTRLHIALGSAKGILYLHTEADPPILHRDIKAANILLDSRFTAKVADFGLSRLAPVSDDGVVSGHISTVVKGTPGYLDPEYFLTQRLTDKSDVYSLGVVFLELLTGFRPISIGKNIVREVRSACESGTISSILDKRMGTTYPSEAAEMFMRLALKCCEPEMEKRPPMLEVVKELEIIKKIPSASARLSSEIVVVHLPNHPESSTIVSIPTSSTSATSASSYDIFPR